MSNRQPEVNESDRKQIIEIRNRVREIRRHYWEERMVHNTVKEQTHQRLAAAAISYRDALIDYHNEGGLNPPWEKRELDWIMEYVDQTVAVPTKPAGRSSSSEPVQKPAILHVDHRKIYRLTKSLDLVAKDLGFAAKAVPEDRPRGRIEVPE